MERVETCIICRQPLHWRSGRTCTHTAEEWRQHEERAHLAEGAPVNRQQKRAQLKQRRNIKL